MLDYSRTSTLARWIRDEIRNVAPDFTSASLTGIECG